VWRGRDQGIAIPRLLHKAMRDVAIDTGRADGISVALFGALGTVLAVIFPRPPLIAADRNR
jgi:hypothetical protein